MKARGRAAFWLVAAIATLFIAVAAWIFIPTCRSHGIPRAKELVLRQNLDTLRRTIDAYTYDKRRAPPSLDSLVDAGYLRRIPADPITGRPDWQMVGTDVRSSSNETSCEGTLYNAW